MRAVPEEHERVFRSKIIGRALVLDERVRPEVVEDAPSG
jgi:hypothetical protein